MHYNDPDDLKKLGEFKGLAPKEFSTFVEFDKIVGRDDGAIPRKYRELIALAVACTTQCPYCLDVHTRAAKRAGATREEVIRVFRVAASHHAPVFTHVRSAGRKEPGSSIEAVAEVIGAAAISGSPMGNDEVCTQAGIDKVKDMLK